MVFGARGTHCGGGVGVMWEIQKDSWKISRDDEGESKQKKIQDHLKEGKCNAQGLKCSLSFFLSLVLNRCFGYILIQRTLWGN